MAANCKHWKKGPIAGFGLCALGVFEMPSMGVCRNCKKREEVHPVTDLILKNRQGAGDQVLLTAVARDLHAAHPQRFRVAVDCWGMELFQNSPHVVPIEQLGADAKRLTIEGFTPGEDQPHLVTQFVRNLSRQLDLPIETTRFSGDIHLSREERKSPHPFDGEPYWLAWFGGHHGMTTKWWNPDHAQKVVNHFKGKLLFVQAGASGHFHPTIDGAINRVGVSTMRDMVMLMYHAQGGISPVSFGMHLSAAVPTPTGGLPHRPHVVIAGGRESPMIFQYPNHTILHTIGRYRCCRGGACWKNLTTRHNKGVSADCEQVVTYESKVAGQRLSLAKCMTEGVTPHKVIDAIEGYLGAQQDHEAYQEQQKLEAFKRANVTRPACVGCEHHLGLTGLKLVAHCAHEKATRCCGDRKIGCVNLATGRCPVGKFEDGKLAAVEAAATERVEG